MLPTLIDLNDISIRVANDEQLIVSSPGYAVIRDNKIAFGKTAEQLAHIYPLTTHNDFWYKLGQDAIRSASNDIRHNADLAYMHLNEIYEQAGEPINSLIAVPASLNREQLALFLGLLKAANFQQVKLVDSALLASNQILNNGHYSHIDIQLHQTVITQLGADEDSEVIDSECSTEMSMLGVYQQCAKLISEALIDQSRFDPLHNAETEQLLYEKIPSCLDSLSHASTTHFTIDYHGKGHSAVIKREAIIELLSPNYQAIRNKINTSDKLVVSHRCQQLPGFLDDFTDALLLDEHAVFTGAKQHAEFLHNADANSNYLSTLPLLKTDEVSSNKNQQETTHITHALIGHTAHRLNAQTVFFDAKHNSHQSTNQDIHYSIQATNDSYSIHPENNHSIILNDTPTKDTANLHLGDTVRLKSNNNMTVTLIKVM